MSNDRWHNPAPVRAATVLAAALLLIGCNSESASLWELADPGGGGAAPAIYAVPGTTHLFVSSDVGGIRYSDDAGEQYTVINEGLDFSNTASDNFQDLTGYRHGEIRHVVGSATAGILYWRYIGPDGLSPEWRKFFDARDGERQGATSLGALAVDAAERFLYAGVGNSNSLALNRMARVDPNLSGHIYYFATTDAAASPAPPESAGMLSLGRVCRDVDAGPYLHVSDLAAVTVDGEEYLYAGTTDGLLVIRRPRETDAECRQLTAPDRNRHVLAVQASTSAPQDVIVLLNETGLDERDTRAGGKKNAVPGKGGLFHVRSVLAAAPQWVEITPPEARGQAVGGLERARQRPQELVLTGDAQSALGVLFTTDFTTGRWDSILDRRFVSGNGAGKGQDGWRRSPGAFRGVKEIAVAEDAAGISRLYVAGFQGRLMNGLRDGDGFRFEQGYTRVERSGGRTLYRSRGVPLMNPWRSFADPGAPGRAIFLYHDNLMFVSDDSGASFMRPVEQFGWGTDAIFHGESERTFVSWSRGNHLESGRRQRAERGGILVGNARATEWDELQPAIPATGPVEALTLAGNELCANVYREGVFCTSVDSSIRWRRKSPESLEVLHMVDVPDDPALWVVSEAGQSREVCRIGTGSPVCSRLPANRRDFVRLWYDEGRLWLSTGAGRTFSSDVAPAPAWERLDTEITDLRTLTIDGARFSLIASGTEGLFVSRTPRDRATWCPAPMAGLNGNLAITTIADPAGGDYLYVAAAGVGFYRVALANFGGALADCQQADAGDESAALPAAR